MKYPILFYTIRQEKLITRDFGQNSTFVTIIKMKKNIENEKIEKKLKII